MARVCSVLFTLVSTALVSTVIGTQVVAQDWRPSVITNSYAPIAPPSQFAEPAPPAVGPNSPTVFPDVFGPAIITDPVWSPGIGPQCGPMWLPQHRAWPFGCRYGCCPDRWYAQADALWLKRGRANNRNLTYHVDSQTIILDTDDLIFDLQSGTRLTLGRYISERTSIEGTFFGFHDWNAHAGTPNFGPQSLNSYWGRSDINAFLQTDAFDSAAQQSAFYSSELESWELGLRKRVSHNGSVLIGFRYLDFSENFALHSLKVRGNGAEQQGLYSIDTDNNLAGIQIGGDFLRGLPSKRLQVALTGKAGLFINFHEQRNRLFSEFRPSNSNPQAPVDDARSVSSTGLASVLEFGVTVTFRVSDHISLRGGYTHLFLTGVALAPDQLDDSPTRRNSREFINDKGSLHLQGPFVGGEIILP